MSPLEIGIFRARIFFDLINETGDLLMMDHPDESTFITCQSSLHRSMYSSLFICATLKYTSSVGESKVAMPRSVAKAESRLALDRPF